MGDETREAVPTEQYVYDGCLLDTGGMASEPALLAAAKREVLSAISTYDASDSVNTLVVNGQRGWLDKATRVGLMNGVAVAKACGMERMSLWIDGREYVMDVARLEALLVKVEVYANEQDAQAHALPLHSRRAILDLADAPRLVQGSSPAEAA